MIEKSNNTNYLKQCCLLGLKNNECQTLENTCFRDQDHNPSLQSRSVVPEISIVWIFALIHDVPELSVPLLWIFSLGRDKHILQYNHGSKVKFLSLCVYIISILI